MSRAGLGFWSPAAAPAEPVQYRLRLFGSHGIFTGDVASRFSTTNTNWTFWFRAEATSRIQWESDYLAHGGNSTNSNHIRRFRPQSGSGWMGYQKKVGSNYYHHNTPRNSRWHDPDQKYRVIALNFGVTSAMEFWEEGTRYSAGAHGSEEWLAPGNQTLGSTTRDESWWGYIDEVAFWDVALSDSSIADCYAGGPGAVGTPPIMWHDMKFNGPPGTVIPDITGNGNHTNLVGSEYEWVERPPATYSLVFDGNTYIELPQAFADLFLTGFDIGFGVDAVRAASDTVNGRRELLQARNTAGQDVSFRFRQASGNPAIGSQFFEDTERRENFGGSTYTPYDRWSCMHWGPGLPLNRDMQPGFFSGSGTANVGAQRPSVPGARIGARLDGVNGFQGNIYRAAAWEGNPGTADRNLWYAGENDPDAYAERPMALWLMEGFEEPGATIIPDITGNGYDGTVVGGSWEEVS